MNIDTKLFRYSTTRLSNYDGNESTGSLQIFEKEKRKGRKEKWCSIGLIISRLLAYIKFTQRRGSRRDRSIFRKAASIDKQIIGRDVIFRDGV